MEDTYIIMIENASGFDAKGYTSFSRLCLENGLNKKVVNKKMVPFKVENKTVFKVKIDNRI
jgi:hypothetical protein